ncbi:MAG: hypothetical protein Q8P18_14895 [Pseudomonadota bacterium]|nr:hypothetical protein [Pseudomonadota bacterium]
MRFPLPDAPPGLLLPALTSPAALCRWWDPDAEVVGARLSPGLDGPTLAVRITGEGVTWEGESVRARFDLAAGAVTLDAEGLDADSRADLAAGWELALAALAWSLTDPRGVRWLRIDVPVALAYADAWSRIAGPEGLAGGGAPEGSAVRVRIAGTGYDARVVLQRPPRAVSLVLPALDGALLRLQIGPGESVNAARLELLLGGDAPLPDGWEPWLAKRFGMSWVAQLGEDG